jgi:ring-1,2-phenylacetyl-CoA epoxidase subunit PaaD
MAWLAQVPDPEIPVLSLTDLGVVRDLRWEGDTLVAAITPTYSGCPATAVIEMSAAAALTARLAPLGLAARIERRLSPPWTTNWIGPAARAKLEAYGIAPPAPAGPARCPRCAGARLERVSQFGSTPCKAQWRCLDCLEPFDHFKCH